MRIGLVILNWNEAAALPVILPKIPRLSVDLCVAVDPGSDDGSPDILRAEGIEVVRQLAPGRGEAFRLGFEHLRDVVDALVFFSPDGNEDPADISKFRLYLEDGADMVIASRMMPGGVNEEDTSSWRPRKWANLAFNWMAYLTWGRGQRRITDGINGFRAITYEAWDALRLSGSGYTIEYQSTIRAYKHHLAVSEFPTVEGQRIGGRSRATSIRTGLSFTALYLSELRHTVRNAR